MWSCKFQLGQFQLDFVKGSWPVEGVCSGSVVDWVWIWIQVYLGSYSDVALTGCEVMDITSSFWDPVVFWKMAVNTLPTYQRCPAQCLSNTRMLISHILVAEDQSGIDSLPHGCLFLSFLFLLFLYVYVTCAPTVTVQPNGAYLPSTGNPKSGLSHFAKISAYFVPLSRFPKSLWFML